MEKIVLQIVVIKKAENEYKTSAMGLGQDGRGEVLETHYGDWEQTIAVLMALTNLLKVAPK